MNQKDHQKKVAFIQWLKVHAPYVYGQVKLSNPALVDTTMPHLAGLGATAPASSSGFTGWLESIGSSIAKAVPIGITAWTQVQAAKLQLQRMKTGQPPIDTRPYQNKMQPTITTQVGVSPGSKKMIYIVGAGIAGLVLFSMMRQKGRR